MSKVYWGLSNVYYSLYDETLKTFEEPKPIKGAVNLGLSIEGDSSDFYADNVKYFSVNANNGYTGDLELAKFTDEFKVDALGYIIDNRGGVAEVSDANQKPFALLFEIKGDVNGRRYVYYNTTATRPTRSHATEAGTREPKTETSTLTIIPHLIDGVNYVGYYLEPTPENAEDYQAWFTEVQLPDTTPDTP